PQRRRDTLQVRLRSGCAGEPFHLASMHSGESVAQRMPLVGQAHKRRPAVMLRALLPQIPVLDHFLEAGTDGRSEEADAQRQLADAHRGRPDVEQHHGLDVVDVADAEPIELHLDEFEELPVKLPQQRHDFTVMVAHSTSWGASKREKCDEFLIANSEHGSPPDVYIYKSPSGESGKVAPRIVSFLACFWRATAALSKQPTTVGPSGVRTPSRRRRNLRIRSGTC